MNAGGVFTAGRWGGVPFIRNLSRANALLYHQTVGLTTQLMANHIVPWDRSATSGQQPPVWSWPGVLVSLASDILHIDQWRTDHPEYQAWKGRHVALVPTSFDRFEPALCRLLVYRGWWLVGAILAAKYPDFAPHPSSAPAVA